MQISLGGMSPPLHEQIGCEEQLVEIHQRATDSIVFLRIHGFLPDGEAHKANKRLIKDLGKVLRDNGFE